MFIMTRTFHSLPDLAWMHNHIHVWQASLQQPSEVIARLAATLSDDELMRAKRFQFENLRESSIIARGILRAILARYTKLSPEQFRFEYTPAGKPYLSKHSGTAGVYFNLSHSGNLVLYAITGNPWIGIDIECIRPISEIDDIAAHTFSAEENNQLRAVAKDQKLGAFFNCWTRKEAFIKAIGDGVSFPLDQFDVSLKPGDPARIMKIFGSEDHAKRWSMYELQPGEGYAAALVVEGKDCLIEFREWDPMKHSHKIEEPK